jgi:hypothetical protein
MMKNRRNFYRLLHVQPDAPMAVIQSSYRALMLKLKQHPDLGGDHETAVLINEAHAVLTDPDKRAAYDDYLRRVGSGSAPFRRQTGNRPSQPAQNPGVRHSTSTRCAFCSAPYQGAVSPGRRCAQCDSPLCPPIPIKPENADQRAVKRFARDGEIALVMQHTRKTCRAMIQDLSPTGMCLIASEPLAIDQVVKIDGAMLSAVARVVSCRSPESSASRLPTVGVEFLTLEFAETQGTFVSQKI